jgi:hypothetical protein
VISGFHRQVDENCAVLGCCAASSGKSLPTLQDNLSVPFSKVGGFLTFEGGTDYYLS